MADPIDDPALSALPADLVDEARRLDAEDPLAALRAEFVTPPGVVAYLDGNSLGRPLRATRDHLGEFVDREWGERLIRAWDEHWMDRPTDVGDRLGRAVLGAAEGQTVIADSTTVMIYKLLRAGLAAQPDRTEVIADTENFPTDRYVLGSVAAELGLTVRWISPDPATGVTLDEVRALLSERTAVVLLSHVAYKSAFIADLPQITAAAHEVGALVLWDLCHAAGAVPLALDDDQVDLAVGCTYKYLNGGPGSPAFGYVASRLHERIRQPITGWMGHDDPFTMGPDYTRAKGIRQIISGTPPILGMLPLSDMLDLVERAGLPAIREKSVALTEYTVRIADQALAPLGVRVASPRDPRVRGGHVTLEHDRMREVVAGLWEQGVIPDFRPPRGLRAGLSPLSTGYLEVATAMARIRQLLAD